MAKQKIKFDISSHNEPGAGWAVTTDDGATREVKAFRTLDGARKYVATVVNVNKRVRFTKHTDTHYTYVH